MQNHSTHHKPENVVNFEKPAVAKDSKVALILNWYKRSSNNLVGEENIRNLSLDELLRIFDAPFWNRNFQCWSVEHHHVAALQPYVRHAIDMRSYAYFIEAYNMELI